MENNTQFKITYYSNKHKKHITRKVSMTTSVDIGVLKLVLNFMTYFDEDAQGYRTAKGSWKVRFNDKRST